MNLQVRGRTIKKTFTQFVETPRLKEVSTLHFIQFKSLRKLYENQITEKCRKLKNKIIPTSYRTCKEYNDLKLFIVAEWIRTPSIYELKKRQIQSCIEDRCKNELNVEQLYLVGQIAKAVGMNKNIEDAEDRFWFLGKDPASTLRTAGYVNITQEKPYIAVNHILRKLKQVQLYENILNNITRRKGIFAKTFNRVVRKVVVQAETLYTE